MLHSYAVQIKSTMISVSISL